MKENLFDRKEYKHTYVLYAYAYRVDGTEILMLNSV